MADLPGGAGLADVAPPEDGGNACRPLEEPSTHKIAHAAPLAIINDEDFVVIAVSGYP